MAILKEYYHAAEDNDQTVYASVYRTQSWTVGEADYDIYSIKIKAKRVGTCTSATLELYANSGDLPTGGVLATCTVDCSAWNTTYEEHEFVFAATYGVNAATKYVWQLKTNGANTSNCLNTPAQNPGAYADGQAGYWINGVGYGTDATRDYWFETYGTGSEEAVGFMTTNSKFWG